MERRKKSQRRTLLGTLSELTHDEIINIFRDFGINNQEWLLAVMGEVARSTSTPIGLLRPTDRMSVELGPIRGFDAIDRFDWVPGNVNHRILTNGTLLDLILGLWNEGDVLIQ